MERERERSEKEKEGRQTEGRERKGREREGREQREEEARLKLIVIQSVCLLSARAAGVCHLIWSKHQS